ncbi:alcohol oxidase [Amylostereum chailletii]|nr:alcohol oxidase [Amylostereum chailletii]
MMQLTVLLAAAALQPALAALLTDLSQLSTKEYDYVVIGAGPGGSTVASRLSEDGNKTVLLVEAGPRDDWENIHIPFLSGTLSPSAVSWNYTTAPAASINNRSVAYPRGHTLGGSTSTNLMVWTRGSSDNYDSWANITGEDAWSWNSIEPLFQQKIEALSPPADGRDTTGEITPSVHGTNGAVGISVQAYLTHTDSLVLKAAEQLGDEFPFNPDMNSGNPLGVGYSQSSVRGGQRQSAAAAYLYPAFNRSNLDILVNTRAVRLNQTGVEDGVPAFRAVQLAQSSDSEIVTVQAKLEVILSAGAVATPQLLLLSGIGDAAELAQHGIEAIVDLPDVGKNLQDHLLLGTTWAINASDTHDDIFRNTSLFAENLQQWRDSKTGQFASSPAGQIAWSRLPENAAIFQSIEDPSAGPSTPHYEIIFQDQFFGPPPAIGHFLSVTAALVTATSRGSITLNSTDPFDSPIIDPKFLSTDFDVFATREAAKAIQRFMAADAWAGYVIGPYGDFQFSTTDDQIDAFARQTAGTVFHPVGTASMSGWNATDGVVNPDLTVKKVKGLRIVDASVMPTIPAAHTQAATYIVAERGVEFIRNSTSA